MHNVFGSDGRRGREGGTGRCVVAVLIPPGMRKGKRACNSRGEEARQRRKEPKNEEGQKKKDGRGGPRLPTVKGRRGC